MAAFRDPGSLSPALAGTLGGLLATWVTFTPCFLWIFLGALLLEAARRAAARGGAPGGPRRRGRGGPPPPPLLPPPPPPPPPPPARPHPRPPRPGPGRRRSLGGHSGGCGLIAVFRYRLGTLPLLGAAAVAGPLLRLLGALPERRAQPKRSLSAAAAASTITAKPTERTSAATSPR